MKTKKKKGHKGSRRWHRYFSKRAVAPFTISMSTEAYNKHIPTIPRCKSIQNSKK